MRVMAPAQVELKAWYAAERRAEARALWAVRAWRRRRLRFAELWEALQACPQGPVRCRVEAEVLGHKASLLERLWPCA